MKNGKKKIFVYVLDVLEQLKKQVVVMLWFVVVTHMESKFFLFVDLLICLFVCLFVH